MWDVGIVGVGDGCLFVLLLMLRKGSYRGGGGGNEEMIVVGCVVSQRGRTVGR